MNVAIIHKYKSNVNFKQYLPDTEFTEYYMCDSNVKKPLKKDISETFIAEYNEDNYDFIILIGADVLKHIGKSTNITKYQGTLINEKYIPLVSPSMLKFRPDMTPLFEKSIRDVLNIINNTIPEKSELTLNLIDDEDDADKFFVHMYSLYKQGKLKKGVAVDTETSALYNRQGYILGLCLAWDENEGYYINADVISDISIDILRKIFLDTTAIFHNYKFDAAFLKYHFNLEFPKWEDTMLLHYLLDENAAHGLKDLSIKYTDLGEYDKKLDDFKKQYCRENKVLVRDFSYSMIPFELLGEYGAIDPIATLRLYNKFFPVVDKNKKTLNRVYTEILKPGTEFLLQIEDNGVPFSIEVLEEAQTALSQSISKMEKALYDFPEVHILEKQQGKILNVNSPVQVRTLLFDIIGLRPSKKTDTGAWSTDAEVLEGLAKEHKLPEAILAIKKAKKVKSTYIDKILLGLDSDSRLRTGFHLHTTTSGRLSSSGLGKINMQQLPRNGIDGKNWPKLAIKARKGFSIVNGDMTTAEMYFASTLSKDTSLQEIFISGKDFHSIMAQKKYDLPYTWQEIMKNHKDIRQDAKSISFSILYKLDLKEPVLKSYPILKGWLKKEMAYIKEHGFIYSAFGRKRRLGNVFSSNSQESSHTIRSGVNFLVQSISSDTNLLGGIELQKWIVKEGLQDKIRIFAMVHDSLLAEVSNDMVDIYSKKLTECIQRDRGISILGTPIGVDVEVGPSYGELEEVI